MAGESHTGSDPSIAQAASHVQAIPPSAGYISGRAHMVHLEKPGNWPGRDCGIEEGDQANLVTVSGLKQNWMNLYSILLELPDAVVLRM
jgi:hypothetical protein